jgi:hypothetical protein
MPASSPVAFATIADREGSMTSSRKLPISLILAAGALAGCQDGRVVFEAPR